MLRVMGRVALFILSPIFATVAMVFMICRLVFLVFIGNLRYKIAFLNYSIKCIGFYGLLLAAIGMIILIFPVEILTTIFSFSHKTNVLIYQIGLLMFFSFGFLAGIEDEGMPERKAIEEFDLKITTRTRGGVKL